MFCLVDDKGVIHIFKPKPWWIGSSADGFGFKLFHEQVSYNGTNGRTLGCTMDLFIIPTMEKEIGIIQAEFLQYSDVLYGRGGPVI